MLWIDYIQDLMVEITIYLMDSTQQGSYIMGGYGGKPARYR